MTAADAQRAQYGPAGRGAIRVGGPWTNIGPYRSNWIQNGLQVQESDTGRIRTFLVHPTNPDVLYVLTSSGGLWKTTNFSHPRPAWPAITDTILSTSGGSAALGKNPETIYLGTGDPFDPGVGGYARRSTDGGETWSAAIKLGASTIVPDVKVDTSGPAGRRADGNQCRAVPVHRRRPDLWRRAGAERPDLEPGAHERGMAGGPHRRAERLDLVPPTRVRPGRHSQRRRHLQRRRPHDAGRRTPGDSVVYAFAATTGNGAQGSVPIDGRRPELDGARSWPIRDHAPQRTVPDVGRRSRQPERGSAEHGHHGRPGVLQPHGAGRSERPVAQHGLHRRPAQLGEVDRWRRDVAHDHELARAVQPSVRACRLPRRRVHDPQGRPAILFGTDGGLFISTDGGACSAARRTTACRRI